MSAVAMFVNLREKGASAGMVLSVSLTLTEGIVNPFFSAPEQRRCVRLRAILSTSLFVYLGRILVI
jgi:hypothetical protein